jgi:hypothetical protein
VASKHTKSSAPTRSTGTLTSVSDSGFWYVGHAPDGVVAELRPAFTAFATRVQSDQRVLQALQAWRALPASIHGPEPGGAIESAAHQFLDAFWSATADSNLFYACALDDHEDETWDLSEPHQPDEPPRAIFAATPGLPTVSLLYLGIGPERAKWLPGHLGTFALTHDELSEIAHPVRHAHAMSPAERAEAVRRMYTWLNIGSAHGFPAVHLLSALPDLIGSALGRGLGLVGATMTA